VSVDKRGDSWRARYRGPDGRQRQRSFRRKIDAERWLAEQQARLTRGEWVDPAASRVTFGVVAAEWLDAAAHLKPKTRASYSSLLRTRVLPTWERVPVGKVTHDGVASWTAGMARTGLSPSRIRQAVYVVAAVCDYAIRTDRLTRNPAHGVKLPRLTRRAERRYLTHAEVTALADAAGRRGVVYARLIRLLAYTGLRWGEVTALRVRDVDLSRRRLDVRRAFADVGGLLVEGTPKSHQQRTVPLLPLVAVDLVEQLADRQPDDLVFTAPAGGPLRIGNVRNRVWDPAVRETGLIGLTPHGLRHTAASLYIAAGTPPKVVQRILGHSSIAITLDLYGHLYPDEMDTWAVHLDGVARNHLWAERGQDATDEGDDGPAGTPVRL
jgi:integrase